MQASEWSLTRPMDCMNANIVVGPTNFHPRFFRFFDITMEDADIVSDCGAELDRVGLVPPDVCSERALRVDEVDGTLGVVDDGFDLAPMPDDACIAEQALDIAATEAGDLLDVEVGERHAEGRPLVEDRAPAQPGLEAFEAELLEQSLVVRGRLTPLVVVVGQELRRSACPRTAHQPVRPHPLAHARTLSGQKRKVAGHRPKSRNRAVHIRHHGWYACSVGGVNETCPAAHGHRARPG